MVVSFLDLKIPLRFSWKVHVCNEFISTDRYNFIDFLFDYSMRGEFVSNFSAGSTSSGITDKFSAGKERSSSGIFYLRRLRCSEAPC